MLEPFICFVVCGLALGLACVSALSRYDKNAAVAQPKRPIYSYIPVMAVGNG